MATTIVESSRELNQLFRDISSKFSPAESENVVKSSKRIYGKQFGSLENQDVLSCLGLLLKLGYVSNTKLTLIREFFAPMSNKGKDISETIDNFRASRPLQADLEKELQGRSEDFKEITDMLKTGQPAVVNLHGSSGVGKTTLAKAICSKWRGKSYVFDLREAKNMRAIYFHIMKNLGLTVPVGYLSFSYVVDRICEHTVKDSDGQPVLFLLDNVEQFTLGQGKEGKNLRTAFMQFLGKLSECDDSGTMRPLRVLLTSRTRLNDAQKVIDHELQPLKDSDSEKVLLPKEMSDLDTELKEKLVAICNRKPLFLKGVRAIFQQGRKAPNDLIDELEKTIHMANKEKADTPEKSKLEEDSKEKPFDLEKEGVDTSEQSVMKEMFSTLPSDNLKLSAVSISLFCGPFTAMTAAKVLGISQAEAVAQLEGLETSAVVFVVNREAKELMYDIHPLLKKYAESIKSGAKFAETYLKARERFYEHFMSEMKTIAGFIESDYVKAFNQFANDQPNFEFTIEISLLPEFFSVPGEFHDNALIASLVHAMLSTEKQRELFHSWAEICPDDEKSGSLFRAQLRCWEARQMLDAGGPRKAFEVLQQAALSLEKVQDRTTESFQLTRGLYLYFEGEIYCQKKDFKKALECLHSSLELTEKVIEVHTNVAKCYNAMGNCYYALNKREKALEFYTKALEMRKELSKGSEYHYDMPVYKNQIGTVYEDQGEYEKAVECYTDAIRLLEELKISGYEDEALFCRNLANALLRQNKIQEAIIPADKAYKIRSKLLGSHPDTVRSIFQLGVIQAILRDYQKALERFLEAWEMEKSLEPGNHSAVWKLIMKGVNDMSNFLLDEYEGKEDQETIKGKKEKFKADALGFCKRFWKEERELSQFGFTEYNKGIIDTIMELLGDDEEGRDKYEKETLWFYDGYQSATEADFYNDFEEETDIEELNEMLDRRLEFLQEIVERCVRLDQREKRVELEEKKLALYRKALWKTETKGNMVARRKTIKGILLLCKELEKEKLGRRYGKEALRFYEDLWTAQYDEMDITAMKKFLREVKDLALSVGDFDRVKLYQDALQRLIGTGDKPGNTLGQKARDDDGGADADDGDDDDDDADNDDDGDDEEEEVVDVDDESDEVGQEEVLVEQQQDLQEEGGQDIEQNAEGIPEASEQDLSQQLHEFQLEEQQHPAEEDPYKTRIGEIMVANQGTQWDLNLGAVHFMFPPDAVSEATTIVAYRWRCSACSPPLQGHEAVVSNVIQISSPGDEGLEFNTEVKLVLSHSASNLQGYEVVIKRLIDKGRNEWEEIDGSEDIRSPSDMEDYYPCPGDIPDFSFPVVQADITQCSTYATVCRLKSSPSYTITFTGGTFSHPDYPDVSVTVPRKAVPAEVKIPLQLKVQEVPSEEFENMNVFVGPILRIVCSSGVEFSNSVTIQLPISLGDAPEGIPDHSVCRVKVLFLKSEGESKEWVEITEDLENPASFDGKLVTFQVKRFSGYTYFLHWSKDSFSVSGIISCLSRYIWRQPREAAFFAYFKATERLQSQDILYLICCPAHRRKAVKQELEGEGITSSCDGNSKKMMIPGQDKAFVFVSGGISPVDKEDMDDFYLRLREDLQYEDPQDKDLQYRDQLKVRLINHQEYAKVQFRSSPETTGKNLLSKLEFKLPTLNDDRKETPVEFFGVPFDDGILYEARFIGTDGILTACSGVLHDIGKRDIYSNHLDLASKIPEGDAMKSFLMALSRLPEDDQQKCFDAIVGKLEEGGTGMCNVKNRLEKAHKQVTTPLMRRTDVICEVSKKVGSQWKRLARQLQLGKVVDNLSEEENEDCERCYKALERWCQVNGEEATIRKLMTALTKTGLAEVNYDVMRCLELLS